jgi:hypothetical protein
MTVPVFKNAFLKHTVPVLGLDQIKFSNILFFAGLFLNFFIF